MQPIGLPEFADRHIDLWMKRDDLSSFDLSGNKVRKLEFLLGDAIEKKCDCVITIGGIQSNHARATAVAAKQLGLQPYLILRTTKASTETDGIGLVGNLLLDRMVGAKIFTVSSGTYARLGSEALCRQLEEHLISEGRRPYVIPVGGSNALGALGYTECVQEVLAFASQHNTHFDHIVTACGSGGTVAGLAIGIALSGMKTQLHAVGVCDSPEYFYDHIQQVATELSIDTTASGLGPVTSWCNIYDGQGVGYARSTDEELSFLLQVAERTGIVLDPVYSGKALFHLVKTLLPSDVFKAGQKVLFIHTGGSLGLYDKADQILPLLPDKQVQRLVSVLEK